MIDVLEIKKAIIDKKVEFYIGGNRLYCRSDNGDTIQVFDLSEHDKKIRAEAIDEFIDWLYKRRDISFHESQYMKSWFLSEQFKEQKGE